MSDLDVDINEMSSKILQEKLIRLNERNDQRKAIETRRRKDRFEMGSHAEQAEVFSETFKEHQKKIEYELNDALEAEKAGETRNKLTIRLDHIFQIIDALKRYMTESSMFLTAFDNEQAKIEFQDIMNKFNHTRDSLLPKKKFGFNSKSKLTNSSVNQKPVEISNPVHSKPKFNIAVSEFGFVDQSDQILRLNEDEVNFKDITLRNLTNCKVYLIGHPGSVYIHKVIDCTIVCGPTHRSFFIEHACNSQFYFACQQGRIHNTNDCDFYVHVTSKAIIEDCHDVRFAPYLLQYENLEDDFKVSLLNLNVNNWNQVEDFKHLSVDVPSPNWKVIDESERKFLNIN